MTKKVQKRLDEVVNIIIGNHDNYTKEQIVDILSHFADHDKANEIQRNVNKMSLPLYELPSDMYLKRMSVIESQDDGQREQTRDIHKIHLESGFWINHEHNPFSQSDYRGWRYVVRFTDESWSGHWYVRESDIMLKPLSGKKDEIW